MNIDYKCYITLSTLINIEKNTLAISDESLINRFEKVHRRVQKRIPMQLCISRLGIWWHFHVACMLIDWCIDLSIEFRLKRHSHIKSSLTRSMDWNRAEEKQFWIKSFKFVSIHVLIIYDRYFIVSPFHLHDFWGVIFLFVYVCVWVCAYTSICLTFCLLAR